MIAMNARGRLLRTLKTGLGAGLISMACLAEGGTLPERTQLQPDVVGGKGAPVVTWKYQEAPSEGLTAVSVKMRPLLVAGDAPEERSNAIYWAYSSRFTGGRAWYMGMQPNPRDGHKVLFSVFGEGAVPISDNCKSGADGGPGARCHLAYPWKVGGSYTFRASLLSQDDSLETWNGIVKDDATGEELEIGRISVPLSHGLLATTVGTFSEFYHRTVACEVRPLSEVLISDLVGEADGKKYAAQLQQTNANGGPGGCNPYFFGDHKTYVYLRQGTMP